MNFSLYMTYRRGRAVSKRIGFYGFVCTGFVGLLLLGKLQAAPRAPLGLKSGQSCANAQCHNAQTSFRHLHTKGKKELCIHCHKPVKPTRHRFRPADKTQRVCIGCHKKYSQTHPVRKSWRFEHGPVAAGDCLSCHQPHGSNHRNLLRKKAGQSCSICHSDLSHPKPPHPGLHKPVKQGKCLTCHVSHGSKTRHLLRANPIESCLKCHKKVREKLAKTRAHHGAMERGQRCLNCHTGHAALHKYMLRRPDSKLCLGCHNKAVVTFGKKRLINIAHYLKTHKVHHKPITKGKCTACHKAHGSLHRKLLAENLPRTLYSKFSKTQYALCFSCHKPELVTTKQTYRATKFRNGALNLHYLHTMQKKGHSCRFCHNVHASHKPHLIRETVRFGRWDLPVGFKKMPHGGTCQTACHHTRKYNRSKPALKGYSSYKKLLVAPKIARPPPHRSKE